MAPLAETLRRQWDASVETFIWDGTLAALASHASVIDCWEAMSAFLGTGRESLGNTRRVVIAKSGGASLVDRALQEHLTPVASNPFDVEVRIASPIHGTRASVLSFSCRFLLVSRKDWLYRCARAALTPVRMQIERYDPAQRVIQLDELRHGDFNVDRAVVFEQRPIQLYDLFGRLVRDGSLASQEATCPTT
jgi:hypothetical protein